MMQGTQNVEQAVREAQQAAQEGARAAAEARAAREAGRIVRVEEIPAPPAPGSGETGTIQRVVIGGELPHQVEGIAYMFFITIASIVILRPLMSAFGRRLERRPAAATLPPETAQQIARIEQAVEAMAIEVERISEGQRFTAKLLAERERIAG